MKGRGPHNQLMLLHILAFTFFLALIYLVYIVPRSTTLPYVSATIWSAIHTNFLKKLPHHLAALVSPSVTMSDMFSPEALSSFPSLMSSGSSTPFIVYNMYNSILRTVIIQVNQARVKYTDQSITILSTVLSRIPKIISRQVLIRL